MTDRIYNYMLCYDCFCLRIFPYLYYLIDMLFGQSHNISNGFFQSQQINSMINLELKFDP